MAWWEIHQKIWEKSSVRCKTPEKSRTINGISARYILCRLEWCTAHSLWIVCHLELYIKDAVLFALYVLWLHYVEGCVLSLWYYLILYLFCSSLCEFALFLSMNNSLIWFFAVLNSDALSECMDRGRLILIDILLIARINDPDIQCIVCSRWIALLQWHAKCLARFWILRSLPCAFSGNLDKLCDFCTFQKIGIEWSGLIK